MQHQLQITRTGCATPVRATHGRPCLVARPQTRPSVVCAAKEDKDDAVAGAIKAASGLVEKATDLVPDSVPRPAAKAGVTIAGVMFVFWVLQKVISGVVTLALFAGVGYYFLTQQAKGDDDTIDVTSSASSSSPSKKAGKGGASGQDLDDPLAEARRIMDKYK